MKIENSRLVVRRLVTGKDGREIKFSPRACENALMYFYITVICHKNGYFLSGKQEGMPVRKAKRTSAGAVLRTAYIK